MGDFLFVISGSRDMGVEESELLYSFVVSRFGGEFVISVFHCIYESFELLNPLMFNCHWVRA